MARTIDISKKNELIRGASDKGPVFAVHELKTNRPVLFFKGRRVESFFTEDSKLYITPKEMRLISSGVRLDRKLKKWDNLSSRIVSDYRRMKVRESDFLFEKFRSSYELLAESMEEVSGSIVGRFSVAKLWNMSIVASILFGMFSMTMIYKYLGQGASASEARSKVAGGQIAIEAKQETTESKLAEEGESYTRLFLNDSMNQKEGDLEKEIREMVKGYPIEEMVPYIAQKDRTVAAFLVGIAKKESNWGKRVPLLNGQDCYNYWGYRGIRKLMGTGGHTCFNSRKDAVDTVAKRIKWLIENEELNTPEKMVIWKCGSNCNATGGWAAANKWISDVNMYFSKLNSPEE